VRRAGKRKTLYVIKTERPASDEGAGYLLRVVYWVIARITFVLRPIPVRHIEELDPGPAALWHFVRNDAITQRDLDSFRFGYGMIMTDRTSKHGQNLAVSRQQSAAPPELSARRQAELYWNEMGQLKIAAVCTRLYRSRLGGWGHRIEFVRAIAAAASPPGRGGGITPSFGPGLSRWPR
jgi:hypothetical protein